MKPLDKLGQVLIQKLRDQNFELCLQRKNYARSLTKEEYQKLPRNPNYDKELQKIDDERFEFLNDLSDKQFKILDKLVLSLLDVTAFNFLREVEETLMSDQSIGLTIDGNKAETLMMKLNSGTFFGEYFDWCAYKSKYRPFQH